MQHKLRFHPTARIVDSLTFEEPVAIFENVTVKEARIGAYTYLARGCWVVGSDLGRYCSIGAHCTISPGQHPTDRLTSSAALYQGIFDNFYKKQKPFIEFEAFAPASIGHDVWIGDRSIVLDRVKVGHGAIIAAGSVVTKDVPPYTIVGGMPAKIIRDRFPDTILQRLLKLEPWNYDLLRWSDTIDSFGNLDERALDELEASIRDGIAPKMHTRVLRIEFDQTGADHWTVLQA